MLRDFQKWPTSDYEHQEILKVFKQDRPLDGIVNDFSEFGISISPTNAQIQKKSSLRR